MLLSLKEQELDLLGLMAVFREQATTCDSKPTKTVGTYCSESDKGHDPVGSSLPWHGQTPQIAQCLVAVMY